jgi:hypothetical protein
MVVTAAATVQRLQAPGGFEACGDESAAGFEAVADGELSSGDDEDCSITGGGAEDDAADDSSEVSTQGQQYTHKSCSCCLEGAKIFTTAFLIDFMCSVARQDLYYNLH